MDKLESFQEDVLQGLKDYPKRLQSKYFYDENGAALFQRIMDMPAYYLTACELEIFRDKTTELAEVLHVQQEPFDLIELGAGDAMKSSFLLEHLVREQVDFTYMPVDICEPVLLTLCDRLQQDLPGLEVIPWHGENLEMLRKATEQSDRRKIVLFLGSNIGNMELDEAHGFCRSVSRRLKADDMMLIGFDLQKNPHTVLEAYNDKEGITGAFNLNLLERINRELHADFNTTAFQHYQAYDPIDGGCRSYLVSLADQKVHIGEECIPFVINEPIAVEISRKYTTTEIDRMAIECGFAPIAQIADSKNWFVDAIWHIK
ncbi:L-histidine N(alpha)-methyltransferase [Sphingobacterium corticibacterium]|uniref:L-histidine N(Alpha)-methyltransferase n=1 Tax=Sphingobacterium corticibacterium TaxID=2484746 RepID=A0A4Q6XIC2_9SPHI|nr:L-histidine N(alpha)-methyltransferase [Sphingobacterium corticibacterium]RZF58955.1 L-histidine N(alpha)-methyltransferase [Sphingobacterium corticibacterium]